MRSVFSSVLFHNNNTEDDLRVFVDKGDIMLKPLTAYIWSLKAFATPRVAREQRHVCITLFALMILYLAGNHMCKMFVGH